MQRWADATNKYAADTGYKKFGALVGIADIKAFVACMFGSSTYV